MNNSPLPPVAVIAGPTASGKSAAAIRLAERVGGVVVNADSAQVYRDLRVLTARPTAADEARVPHRLFGHLDAADPCSAARWAADAKEEIERAHAAGAVPVLVGGTGLYLRTLVDGIAPVPPIDPAVRAAVRALPVRQAHWRLAQADPDAAARLAPADTARVARALEVALSTGRPIRDWQAERTGGLGGRVRLCAAVLLPDRAALMERCDARLDAMLAGGAPEEVAALVARGLPPDLPAMRAIGVRPIADRLAGRLTAAEARARAQGETRRYAKRQYTWFRHQPPADWQRLNDPVVTTSTLETMLLQG